MLPNKIDPEAAKYLGEIVASTPADPASTTPEPVSAPDIQQKINEMPNAEKLTPTERWIYGKLPGFTQSTIGKALAAFNESWAGKALSVLDIPAEGIERTSGLVVQLLNQKPGEELNLRDAWYAGSLTGDVMNLPGLTYDDKGRVNGISLPGQDLPGTESLGVYRKQIADLIAQGVEPGQALVQVRDQYYNGLGAVAMRAQLHDTFFHVVADPLNYILPALKPVEALKARALSAIGRQMAYSADELAKMETGLRDAAKVAKSAEEAASLVQKADGVADVARQIASGEMKILTTMDKVAMFVTRSDDFAKNDNRIIQWLTKPFQLTPESRAKEMLTLVQDNINTRIIADLIDDPEAVTKISSAIGRAADGAVGKEFGHFFLTRAGATIQGFLGGSKAIASEAADQWKFFAKERAILEDISQGIGQDVYKTLKQAGDSPETLLRLIANKLGPEVVAQKGITAEILGQLAAELKDTPWLFDKQAWVIKVMDDIQERAMRQAILQFGVKERGWATRLSLAMKSAESLAFMRLNPAYGIRNLVNNDITMIARGAFGLMSEREIADFWKIAGFKPSRLAEGFALAGESEATKSERKAQKLLQDALSGGKKGFLEKTQDFFHGAPTGALDVTKWSAEVEQKASIRATTMGYRQWWDNYYKPISLGNRLTTAEADALEAASPGAIRLIDQAIRGSHGVASRIDDAVGMNLHLSMGAVFDAVEAKTGRRVMEELGTEITSYFSDHYLQAAKDGKLDQFFSEVEKMLDKHNAGVFKDNLENYIGDLAERAQAEGPQVFYRAFGDVQDAFWSANTEHAYKYSHGAADAARAAAKAKDYAAASALWTKQMAEDRTFFGALFDYADGTMVALEKGGARGGFKVPPDVRRAFAEFRKNWESFFAQRTKGFEEMKGLRGDDWLVAYEKLQDELDAAYKAAVSTEDEISQRIDDVVASLIDNPQQRQVFTNWRDQVAKWRGDARMATARIRKDMRGFSGELREPMWAEFWNQQQRRYSEIAKIERVGKAAMQGDPVAIEILARPTQQAGEQAGEQALREAGNKLGVSESLTEARAGPWAAKRRWPATLPEATGGEQRGPLAAMEQRLAANQSAEQTGRAAMAFNPTGETFTPEGGDIYDLARNYGVDVERSPRNDRRMVKTVNQYAGEKFESVGDIPPDVARKAFEARAVGEATRPASNLPPYVADMDGIAPRQLPFGLALNELTYRQHGTLDAIRLAAMEQAKKTPAMLDNVPAELRDKVLKHLQMTKNELGEARYQATRYALFRRDSALLNYNRRTNADTWISNIFPFAFWTTGSVQKWAVESMDRPAMLTSYLRFKKFFDTSGVSDPNRPSRLQGKIRIHLPFAPAWMGDQFIDPIRMALPFDAFAQPIEQMQQNGMQVSGRAQRLLQDQLGKGEITQQQYDMAIQNQSGPEWDFAVAQVQQNDDSLKFDAWDFASLVSSPHAPIVWAYNVARGHPEDIGPFSPLTRMARNVATSFGVKDYANAPWNMEAKVRSTLGLPIFDKWDNYRIDRALAGMSAEGRASAEDVKRAMAISAEIAKGTPREQLMGDPAWQTYQDAVARANTEASGGIGGTVLSLIGIPSNAYPEGEQLQRGLRDEFGKAYETYKKTDNYDPLNKFFDDHPEYASELALFDKPEERLRRFLVDDMWSKWNSLPVVTKNELKDQLGTDFADKFLSKETRNTNALSVGDLQMYLKLMGGNPVGAMTADQQMVTKLFSGQLKLTEPETAWRAQVFYDTRTGRFPNYYEKQNAYYKLPAGAQRKAYIAKNPDLAQYWDWRRDFMAKNPDIVPYLTDDPKAIAAAQKAQRNPQVAVPTAQELNLSASMQTLLRGYANGEDLPTPARRQIELLAQKYGMTEQEVYGMLGLPAPNQ